MLPVTAALAASGTRLVTKAGNSAHDWPTFHNGPHLQGVASNSSVSTDNAAMLGVAWDTNLYGAALDSPVVAYDSTLGRTLAYIGTERGDLLAIDTATGQIVWSAWLGSPVRSTPAVSDGSVYAATINPPTIFRLNASTGAIGCTYVSSHEFEGSPVVVTPPHGVRTLYLGTNDSATSGPLLAVNAGSCRLEWGFTHFTSVTGSWDPVSYAVDRSGTPLVLFGTSDPNSTVYAVNAKTGTRVWHFATDDPGGTFDVAAGVVVSPPGARNRPDGMVFVPNKFGIMYALDLTTGKKIWAYDFNQALGAFEGGRSTAALDGNDLVFGYNGGIIDVNALTGQKIWGYRDPANTEVLSSPAIAGAAGKQVAAAGDLSGRFEVLAVADGTELYHYQTAGYITASPAVSGGNILIASADGFLYDFAVGGGNQASLPSTTITAPADGGTVANPNGNITLTGAAANTAGSIAGVAVAVQANGPQGRWWDAAKHSWVSGPVGNPATLSAPGASTPSWSFSYPVPPGGGSYKVTVNAVSSAGQADVKGARASFAVLATTTGPHLTVIPGSVPPAGSVTVSGGGFRAAERIAISLDGTTLATATATAAGGIPKTKITIPATAGFGSAALTATGRTSGKSASAAIIVTNSWLQPGYGAAHHGYEPNDSIYRYLVHPGTGIFLQPAWVFATGAAINTAPVILNRVAYVANSAGQLFSIDVRNGAKLWSWSTPTGQGADGSPAVDPAAGLLFVGADDGTLYAVSARTGKTAWHTPIDGGGSVSAPVYGAGHVYVASYVSAANTSTVEGVAEATGAKSWSAVNLPGRVTAPGLDATAKLLVLGTPTGVTGLDTGTGARKWAPFTSGAVTAPPMILGKAVYFGSADHFVYSINKSTGAKNWSHQTGGAVAATPAVANDSASELVVGSQDGNLYLLRSASGSLVFAAANSSPIAGVAAVTGVALFTATTGVVGADRTSFVQGLWNLRTGAGIASAPAIVDGTAYVGAGDGNLYAFTPYGNPPMTPVRRSSP